jgi:hypothetical protein
MVMGGGFWKGGNQEITKPIAPTQFKMVDVYIFYNVIEFFDGKNNQDRKKRPFWTFEIPHGIATIV